MKREVKKGLNGKEVIFLTPETPEEESDLRLEVKAGTVSDLNSFGDFKEEKKKEEEEE